MTTNNGQRVLAVQPRTEEQIYVTSGIDGKLAKRGTPSKWYKKVRTMRRDPTLAFVRDLYMAPILGAEWTVTSDDPAYKDAEGLIYDTFIPKRSKLLRDTLRGLLDYGWQIFERVHAFDDEDKLKVVELKPLLQDITEVLVDKHGAFVGAWNNSSSMTQPVELAADECVLISRDVEGTNWYGDAMMYRAEKPYDSWEECEAAAKRYDTKIAGAHWVIHYPVGTTPYKGTDTDNLDIAKDMLAALESSGKIIVPNKVLQQVSDLNTLDPLRMAWRVELLSAPGSAEASFVGRQRYLDSLKARALGIPERSALEGQFGTRAEAEAHADFAISNIEMGHQDIIEQLNLQLTNSLLELNFGEDYIDKVQLVALPLSDYKRGQIRQLYMAYFNSPAGQKRELERLDWDAMREQLALPTKSDDEVIDDDLLEDGGVQLDEFDTPQGGGDDLSLPPLDEGTEGLSFPDENSTELPQEELT